MYEKNYFFFLNSHQNLLGGSTFSAFRKGQKSTSKFWKHMKQKRSTVRCLNVPYFCFFLEHLNVLLRIFFDVDFWPLLKAGKVLPKQILAEFFFIFNFIFYHPCESIFYIANRITENISHYYTLTIICQWIY